MYTGFIEILKSIFFVKNWQIGIFNISKEEFIKLKNLNKIENNFKKIAPKSKNYLYFADPFPINNQLIIAEAIKKNNQGSLVLIDVKKNNIIKRYKEFKRHASFPFIYFEKFFFLLPEISHWSNQKIFKIDKKNLNIIKSVEIKGLELKKVKDPVLSKINNNYFIFYSLKKSKLVEIVTSKNLFDKFKKVKNYSKSNKNSNPRMAGAIIKIKNHKYRISQNKSRLYGDGVVINKIINFDVNKYSEKYQKTLKFDKIYGPHTINFIGKYLIFDYYTIEFSLFQLVKKIKFKILT